MYVEHNKQYHIKVLFGTCSFHFNGHLLACHPQGKKNIRYIYTGLRFDLGNEGVTLMIINRTCH